MGLIESYQQYMVRRFSDAQSPDSIMAMEALEKIIDHCKTQKIPVSMILFPTLQHSSGQPYIYDFLHKRVIDKCNQKSITCLDLYPAFYPYLNAEDDQKLWVNRFDGHPSPLANHIAAKNIINTFEKIWLSDAID